MAVQLRPRAAGRAVTGARPTTSRPRCAPRRCSPSCPTATSPSWPPAGRRSGCRAGEVLMAEGDAVRRACIVVLDGELEVTRDGGGGPPVLLNVCVPRRPARRARRAAGRAAVGDGAGAHARARAADRRRRPRPAARPPAVGAGAARRPPRAGWPARRPCSASGSGWPRSARSPRGCCTRSTTRPPRSSAQRRPAAARCWPRTAAPARCSALAGPPPADALVRADAAAALARVLADAAPGLGRAAAEQLAAAGIDPAALAEALTAMPVEQRAAEVQRFLREREVADLLEELADRCRAPLPDRHRRPPAGLLRRPGAERGRPARRPGAGARAGAAQDPARRRRGARPVTRRPHRPRPAGGPRPGLDQPARQRRRRGGGARARSPSAPPTAGDRVVVDVENTGPPVPAGGARAGLRPVLHHQADRRGDRPGPDDLAGRGRPAAPRRADPRPGRRRHPGAGGAAAGDDARGAVTAGRPPAGPAAGR